MVNIHGSSAAALPTPVCVGKLEKNDKDLIFECPNGAKLLLSSKLLIEHYEYFERLLNGDFCESKKYHQSESPTSLQQRTTHLSQKILRIVTHFAATKTLPEDEVYEDTDLPELNDMIDFLQVKEEKETKIFRQALLDKIKTEFLRRENALSWYITAMECGNFRGLRSTAIDALKGPISAADFLKIVKQVQKNLPPHEQAFFFKWFLPYCQIDPTKCSREENITILSIVREHHIRPQQKTPFIEAMVGTPSDNDLLTILESLESKIIIEGLTEQETREHCIELLFPRLESWIREIRQNADFDPSKDRIRGMKVKKWKVLHQRIPLPQEPVANLERFAKIAPLLREEQPFLKKIESLRSLEQNWIQSRMNPQPSSLAG